MKTSTFIQKKTNHTNLAQSAAVRIDLVHPSTNTPLQLLFQAAVVSLLSDSWIRFASRRAQVGVILRLLLLQSLLPLPIGVPLIGLCIRAVILRERKAKTKTRDLTTRRPSQLTTLGIRLPTDNHPFPGVLAAQAQTYTQQ